MKKIIFALMLFCNQFYGQEVNMIWSEEIPTKSKSGVTILGSNGTQYYVTYVDKDDNLKGRIFDRKMTLVKEAQINFNLNEETKYNYKGAYFLKENILHFISYHQKKNKQSYLYSGTTDFQLNTSDKLKVLNEVEEQKVENFGLYSISPDSTKVLTYFELKSKKKEPSILVYKVFDSKMENVLNEGSVSLPIKSKNYSTEEIRVDNFGNVYVMASVTKERNEMKAKESTYYYKLIVFSKDKTVKEFDFDYPESNIAYADIIAGKDNTFFCTGFLTNLSSGKKGLVSDKMFFTTIDCKTLNIINSKLLEVPGLYPEKINKSQDFVPYKIRQIYQKKDGGFSIVAEQYKLEVRVVNVPNGAHYIENYFYYCDIACVQVDNKYDVTSVTRVPKYQMNARNPSIISTFINDQVYIVYEDVAKNLSANTDKDVKKSGSSIFSSSSNNSIFLLKISHSGEIEKNIIYDYKDTKIKPSILYSKEVRPGEILLNANNQIGLLSIKP